MKNIESIFSLPGSIIIALYVMISEFKMFMKMIDKEVGVFSVYMHEHYVRFEVFIYGFSTLFWFTVIYSLGGML